MSPVPLILVGTEYWGGLMTWMKDVMWQKGHNVSGEDLDLLKLVDNAEDVVQHVLQFYAKHSLQPNF